MEKDLTCKIIMMSKEDAQQLFDIMVEGDFFGKKMKVILDTYDAADEENKVDFEMEDGSMSCKIFKTEGLLLPDNVVAPSKVSIPCSVPRF